MMQLQKRRFTTPALVKLLGLLVVVWLLKTWLFSSAILDFEIGPTNVSSNLGKKVTVVAALKDDDVSWLYDHFPNWHKAIYTMNDPDAELTVAKNVGRESTAYLTYLIDNYHNLPDYMVFLHALRYQWHNEDPLYDGVPPLKNLRLTHVEKHGYVNMRCTHMLGCPNEIKPTKSVEEIESAADPDSRRRNTEAAYSMAFLELFPNTTFRDIPDEVGIQCGAQFALTRWKVLQRPKADYVRYRDWLWTTELPDATSGRILEYTWHMIMGKPAVHCPDAKSCFCEKFGLCNLECHESGSCEKRYQLPRYANLPAGWPDVGPGKDGFPARHWAD